MSFQIHSASETDAPEVADVHLESMQDNALMHAQFPNDESLCYLRHWLTRDTEEHIAVDSKGVLVARTPDGANVTSFVKWHVFHPHSASEDASAEEWPDSCRAVYLDSYADLTAKTRREVLGDRPYYRK